MGDVAYLAGAMRLVVVVAIGVGGDLRPQDEHREDERYGQEVNSESFRHTRGAIVTHPNRANKKNYQFFTFDHLHEIGNWRTSVT